ncbi:hypothetical protein OL548_23610 [Lysinibacillus sp. MHQ-1]|nr:hypothetical protein OL548_23610 [Lysinibacillus sp. MHQ-1]
MWKGRFPSTMARFCTVELKVRPMFDQIYVPIFEAGDKVISWQGIRANESLRRSLKWMRQRKRQKVTQSIGQYSIGMYMTFFSSMISKVLSQIHCKNKVWGELVVCHVSIVKKEELYEIARRFPEEIERVAAGKKLFQKHLSVDLQLSLQVMTEDMESMM